MSDDGILEGYDFDTEYVIPLGRDVVTRHMVQFSLPMGNRHGYITGATGTGKTTALRTLIEWASRNGVSVLVSDAKGDLSGLARPGKLSGKALDRARELEQVDCPDAWWAPTNLNVEFLALAGIGSGAPVRIPIGTFGYRSLSKMVRLTPDQTTALGSAYLASHNDSAGDLETVEDLCAFLRGIGNDPDSGVSEAVVARVINKFRVFESDNPGLFTGPDFDISDLIAQDSDGWGRVSVIDSSRLADYPDILTTFLLWTLERMAKTLPEVGDADLPKCLIFIEEAHLIFNEATKEFLKGLTRTIKVLRSKGVGVYFISQKADDIHEDVLAQCANRIQFALRANTPKEKREIKATVETFPTSDVYDIEKEIREMRTGEALVCVLDDDGRFTPPSVCRFYVPCTQMEPLEEEELFSHIRDSALYRKYRERERAYRERKEASKKVAPPVLIVRQSEQDPGESTERSESVGPVAHLRNLMERVGARESVPSEPRDAVPGDEWE